MLSNNGKIKIKLAKITQKYYIVWELSAIALGKTKQEALENLREATHFGVDSLINQKLRNISEIITTEPRFLK